MEVNSKFTEKNCPYLFIYFLLQETAPVSTACSFEMPSKGSQRAKAPAAYLPLPATAMLVQASPC